MSGTLSVLRGGYWWGHHDGRFQQRPGDADQAARSSHGCRSIALTCRAAAFTTHLFGSRVDYGFRRGCLPARCFSTRRAVQQQPALPVGVPRPGSEFFVVWTDEQDTRPNGLGLRNRAFVLKLTRLLRF